MNIPNFVQDVIIDVRSWWNLRKIRRELPRAAESFGWDPSQPWLRALGSSMEYYNMEDINRARYVMLDLLQVNRYRWMVDSHWVVMAQYDLRSVPTPLEVLHHSPWILRGYGGDMSLQIGPTKATLLHHNGEVIAVINGCGRLPRSTSFQPLIYASKLIAEITGIDQEIDDILDVSGCYDPIFYDRVDGVWAKRLPAPVGR